ncbi:hypothetical protein TRAPUB_5287 [Trametes pubescens]|uniref:Uncharacterized protein n=1 Tax=Trametes pubescens TaxID=154538 RepID=A0A1M2V8V8_TRAPU|nr:hypothetical protein TRAPUB_5287 [Trametes pubescens]
MEGFANDPAQSEPVLGPDSISADLSRQQSVDVDHSGEHDTDDGSGKKKKGSKRRKSGPARNPAHSTHGEHSIKREIGHLCHDERRSSAKEKAPVSNSSSITNPPIDVARALPGKSAFSPRAPLSDLPLTHIYLWSPCRWPVRTSTGRITDERNMARDGHEHGSGRVYVSSGDSE